MLSKRFSFALVGIFLVGIIAGVFVNADKHRSSFSAALGDTPGCERMSDTQRVQCNFDRGPSCGALKYVQNTSYIYELPKDVLHDKKNEQDMAISDCLEGYNQTHDVFWTKYINGTTVTTNESTLQQNPTIPSSPDFPVSNCDTYDTSYICIDTDDTSSIKAYWEKDNQKHYVINRSGNFYEYVSGINSSSQKVWLFNSVQDQFFTIDPRATSTQVFKLKLTQGMAQTGTEIEVQFGKILESGFVQEKTLTLSSTTRTAFDSAYKTSVSVQSKQFSEVNVWRVVVKIPSQTALVSTWIPAKVALDGEIVEFNAQMKILSASQNWLKDFNGTHTAQLYNVVTEQIEENTWGIGGAFKLNENVFLYSDIAQGKQKLFYILPNSGVAPEVSSCSGGEKIHVNNTSAPQRTNYLLSGDKGKFVVIGDNVTNATAITWNISNPEKSRIANAAEISNFSSTSFDFEILPEFMGSTQLENASILTATTQGDDACTMILKVYFQTGLRVGVEQVNAMTQ